MKALGIAIWGLGKHSCERILPALDKVDNLNIIGVCSRSEEVVTECSKKWHCNGWIDPQKMLTNSKVDIVYIASPIGVHFDMAKKSLEAGKHVWCEKPITCNIKDTNTLINLAKDNNKMLAESFMFLHHPQFKKLQDFISDKKNGEVHSIVCRFGMQRLEKPGFRNDPKLCGGAFWDIGSYTVAAILELYPNEKFQVLYSEINKGVDSEVDTQGRALVRFTKGATTYLEWGIGLGYKNEIELWSENSSFFTDKIFSKPVDYSVYYKVRDKNGNESLSYGRKSEQFIDMFNIFHDIYSSPLKVSKEAKKIIRRAELMNQIISFANLI